MRTKKRFSLLLLFLSYILVSSCEGVFEDRIEGNKNVVTEKRTAAEFHEIAVEGNFEVYFTISDSTSLYVKAEENLIPFINTKVSGDRIYIEPKNNYQLDNNRAMKIFITSPYLEGVLLTGAGLIECDSLTTEILSIKITGSGKVEFNNIHMIDLDAKISGSGDIVLSGKADKSKLEITGSGGTYALDLQQNDCVAAITGSGNIYVHVIENLKAYITGSGNIYYKGNPTVSKNITGTGNVKKY